MKFKIKTPTKSLSIEVSDDMSELTLILNSLSKKFDEKYFTKELMNDTFMISPNEKRKSILRVYDTNLMITSSFLREFPFFMDKGRFLEELDDIGEYGKTPLMWSCFSGFFEITKLFLNAGATFKTNIYGETALYYACLIGNEDIVKLLLKLNHTQESGKNNLSPLFWAEFRKDYEIVELLKCNT